MTPRVLLRRWPALATVTAILFAQACAGSDRPIRIGLAGPFTDPAGAPMKLAAQMAVAEINAAGGVGGRPIQLIERITYGDADSAVAVAGELYESDVVAVVGDVFSGATLAAAPVYNGGKKPVVQISPSSSSPEVSGAGAYTFRVCPSDLAHGTALARWARENLGLDRGAVLYLNDEYGRGIRQVFVQEFRVRQGLVVEMDPYLGATPDLEPYVARMANRKAAQFVMVAGNRTEAEVALRLARGRGLRFPFLGGDGLEGIELAGALAEGTYVSAAYLPTLDTPKNRTFVAAYARRYRAGTPNQPAAATYDIIYLLRDVIAKVGPGRRAVRDGVAALGNTTPAFEGVTGTIAFDDRGDVPSQRVVIGQVHDGNVALAEGQ